MRKLLLLSGILALFGRQFANADTVEVRIINFELVVGVGGVAVGDTGWLQCAAASCNFTGSVGNWNIVSDLTVQHTASNPLLDLAYSGSTTDLAPGGTGPGTIVIEGMANGYAVNTPSFELIDNGVGPDMSVFTDAAYGGNNNNICASGASSCWNGTSNPAPSGTSSATIAIGGFFNKGSWGVDQFGPGNSVNPYSLGLIVSLGDVECTPLTVCVTGTFSGDAKIDAAVPEPASVMLLGGVLLFAAAGLRRRTRTA